MKSPGKATGQLKCWVVLWIVQKEASSHTMAGLYHHSPKALQINIRLCHPWLQWFNHFDEEHVKGILHSWTPNTQQIKTISKYMSVVCKSIQAPESCSFSSILIATHKLENSYAIVRLLYTLHQCSIWKTALFIVKLNAAQQFYLERSNFKCNELHPEKREWGSGSTQRWDELILRWSDPL